MIDYENLAKLNRPFFDEMKQSFNETLEGGWYILGGRVKKFEEEYAAFHGMKHCIGVNSGLDAMVLALKAFGFPEGSEVIVPSNTYIATILAVMQAG
ncbi:MAG: DegT/DnrJ/EryC1/StrS family aminotransferase, partial [Ignavibacteriaceae bacterium]|nr:DegT/DnrJ/EryC1/StrS family aminotransferase [Ignavibacteriaceae bacterium]